jgi:serpin B
MDMSRTRRAGPLAVTAAILTALTACGARPTTPATPAPPPSPLPVVKGVPTSTAALVAADDRFGLDLLASPATPRHGNLVVSPASVATALQMVAVGARGRTATELATVLHLPDPATAEALLRSTGDALRIANTVWAQQGLPIEANFTHTLRTRFGATLHTADFERDPDQALNAVNAAVAAQTKGEIQRLFPTGSLDNSTRLVLTNAVYLAADWATAFPADRTRPAPFTREDGSTTQVPMMHSDTGRDPELPPAYGYAQGPGYQVATLPYAGGRLAFTIVLPTGRSLTDVARTIQNTGLPTVLATVRPSPLELSMPKFTVTTDLELSATLASLGMPSAFGDTADFSGITTAEPLCIQTVRHDAVVRVDEHGTTAAAATGVGMRATAGVVARVMTVDHPFLFAITDMATGAPLFLGRVTDPR